MQSKFAAPLRFEGSDVEGCDDEADLDQSMCVKPCTFNTGALLKCSFDI